VGIGTGEYSFDKVDKEGGTKGIKLSTFRTGSLSLETSEIFEASESFGASESFETSEIFEVLSA